MAKLLKPTGRGVPRWLQPKAGPAGSRITRPAATPSWLTKIAAPPPRSAVSEGYVPGWLAGRVTHSAAPPHPVPSPVEDDLGFDAPEFDEVALPATGISGGLDDFSLDDMSLDDIDLDDILGVAADAGGAGTTSVESEEVDLPDWLSEPTPEPQETKMPPDLPDWLSTPAGEPSEPARPQSPASLTLDDTVPDWLSALGGTGAAAAASSEPEPAAEADLPDWLSRPAGEANAPSAPVVSDMPDWLSGFDETPVAARPSGDLPEWPIDTPSATPVQTPGTADLPDWLSEGLEEQPSQPSVPPGIAPSDLPEVPDWLADISKPEPASPAEPPRPVPAAPAGDPLDDLFAELEALPASKPAPSAGTRKPTDDWLENLDFDEVLADEPLSDTDDFLGLGSGLRRPPTEADIDLEALPADLLRTLQGPDVAPGFPAESAEDLEGLRFGSILGEAAQEEDQQERVGALKDVANVIKPEIIFEGQSLRAGSVLEEVVITEEQARRIALLEKMMKEEVSVEEMKRAPRRASSPLVRWLSALAVLAGAALPAFLGRNILPAPVLQAGPTAAHELVEALPSDATVVMIFEYEPDTAAEMAPIADALLEHLASRTDIRVLAASTRPTGPTMVALAFDRADPGRSQGQWINLGYIPGQASGVRGLVVGTLPGIPSRLASDYLGEPTEIDQAELVTLAPDMVIILAARTQELRVWMEQLAPWVDADIIAGTGAGAAPLTYPYVASGQVSALVSGLNGAMAYESIQGDGLVPADSLVVWNTQATGGLAAAIAIVIGSLFFGLRALRGQTRR